MQFTELGTVFMPSEQRTGNSDESIVVLRLLCNSKISLHYINILEFKSLRFIFLFVSSPLPYNYHHFKMRRFSSFHWKY